MSNTKYIQLPCANCGIDAPNLKRTEYKTDRGPIVWCMPCFVGLKITKCFECSVLVAKPYKAIVKDKQETFCEDCYINTTAECPPAGNCGRRIHIRTSRHGHCERCITAHNDAAKNGNHPYFYSSVNQVGDPNNGSFKEMIHRRAYGVEMESNSVSLRYGQIPEISAIRDGSIRGQELITPICYGDEGLALIKKVCDIRPEVGDNCGVHVHLDARDLNWWQVVQIARGYQLLQPVLLQLVRQTRRGNGTCLPITTPYFLFDTKKKFLNCLYTQEASIRKGRHRKYVRKRYEWLNTHSFLYHRTLEVRALEGTFDFNTIKYWVILNQSLFAYFLKTVVLPTDNLVTHLKAACESNVNLWAWIKERIAAHSHKYWAEWLEKPERVKMVFLKEDEKPVTPKPEIERHSAILEEFAYRGAVSGKINRIRKQLAEYYGTPIKEVTPKKPEEKKTGLAELLTEETEYRSPQRVIYSSIPIDSAWGTVSQPVTIHNDELNQAYVAGLEQIERENPMQVQEMREIIREREYDAMLNRTVSMRFPPVRRS